MRTLLIVFGIAFAASLQAADAKAGKVDYDKSCKSCHKPDGSGNPAIAKMMKVEIRDLKSAEVQALSDDELKKVITAGKGKMKPIAGVSEGDAENIVAYIRTWKK